MSHNSSMNYQRFLKPKNKEKIVSQIPTKGKNHNKINNKKIKNKKMRYSWKNSSIKIKVNLNNNQTKINIIISNNIPQHLEVVMGIIK